MTQQAHDNGAVQKTMPFTPASAPSAESIGGFELLQKLGQGGMGTVYKARQPLLDRVVALKVMAPQLDVSEEFVKRFIREAASAASLTHPNMVQVYMAGQDAGRYYIAMEFVEGETLHARIKRKGVIHPMDAATVAFHVAEALNHAWVKAKLIHRDIKPDNIFLSTAGEVKVGDLGLAKVVSEGSTQMTMTGAILGTPHYMSPEQVMGDRNIDFRSDIYSLGCTLFHMVTGKQPYTGESAMQVAMKHLEVPVPSITQAFPACPHHLAKVITRMMAKKASDRYQAYGELIAELHQVYGELLKAGKGISASVVARPRGSRPVVVYAAVAGVGILLAAGLFAWAAWKSGTSPAVPRQERQAAAPAKAAPPSVIAARGGADGAFAAEIAALPAEEQVARVVAKLKELNPGYDGTEQHSVAENAVTEL